MQSQLKFTVYTPVYNDGRFIPRVFESLKSQTNRNFEWVILNDGSKDNSSELIKQLGDCDFAINFIDLKENVGFNKSMNIAVQNAKGELFLISHADDTFKPNSLERFNEVWESLTENQKQILHGVKCNTEDQSGSLIGDLFPHDYWISDVIEIELKYKIRGEKWGTIKTDVLKEFPFPETVKFAPESLVWYKIYNKYKAVFINDTLRIYFVDHNADSLLTRTNQKTNIPLSKRMFELDFLNSYLNRLASHPVLIVKYFTRYIAYNLIGNVSFSTTIGDLNKFYLKILCVIFFPLGLLYAKT